MLAPLAVSNPRFSSAARAIGLEAGIEKNADE
jgi:hypothetical protein